jgi:hypothetical protein
MATQRALDGDDEAASIDAEIRTEMQTDVIGRPDDIDPSACQARERVKRRHAPAHEGVACLHCFEPLLPRGPIYMAVIAGFAAPVHVDCDDPLGVNADFDCRLRLF